MKGGRKGMSQEYECNNKEKNNVCVFDRRASDELRRLLSHEQLSLDVVTTLRRQ